MPSSVMPKCVAAVPLWLPLSTVAASPKRQWVYCRTNMRRAYGPGPQSFQVPAIEGSVLPFQDLNLKWNPSDLLASPVDFEYPVGILPAKLLAGDVVPNQTIPRLLRFATRHNNRRNLPVQAPNQSIASVAYLPFQVE